jgi:hypothetical protein
MVDCVAASASWSLGHGSSLAAIMAEYAYVRSNCTCCNGLSVDAWFIARQAAWHGSARLYRLHQVHVPIVVSRFPAANCLKFEQISEIVRNDRVVIASLVHHRMYQGDHR